MSMLDKKCWCSSEMKTDIYRAGEETDRQRIDISRGRQIVKTVDTAEPSIYVYCRNTEKTGLFILSLP